MENGDVRFGSTFDGVGAMDLGLEHAGIRIVFQTEVDPFRRAVLAEHWPEVQRFSDVRDVRRQPAPGDGERCRWLPRFRDRTG